MWQKERLLNLALAALPVECTKVAWLDADVLFENPNWAITASELLDSYGVVQLFEWIVRLPRGDLDYYGEGSLNPGFARIHGSDPAIVFPDDPTTHGATGIGWAARRDILQKCGLYDACIIGGGDHFMAHVFAGGWNSPCVLRLTGTGRFHEHAFKWARDIQGSVAGRIGVVPGAVYHLWHGDLRTRRYRGRLSILHQNGFDPDRDMAISSSGCWEWTDSNLSLQEDVAAYMLGRSAEAD